MSYLEELRVIESHGSKALDGEESAASDGKARRRDVWRSASWRFRSVGIPRQVIVQEQPAQTQSANPPKFALEQDQSAGHPQGGETEWMRNHLSAETTVRILVKGVLGPREIKKLVRLLEAQRAVLLDDDENEP